MNRFLNRFFLNKSIWIGFIAILLIAIGVIKFFRFKQNTHNIIQPFAYVQLGNHPWLENVQKSLEPVVNQIINDEILKVNSAVIDIPKFYIKKRNIITLLYSNAFSEALHEMIIKNVQQSVQEIKTPISKIYFSNHIDWFGRNKSELVIKIDDSEYFLSKIRKHILQGLKDFKIQSSDATLYDILGIQDANKFDFIPHESIGRIEVQKIEQLSNHETVEKIKEKIAEALRQVIHEMSESNEIIPACIELYGNDFKVIASIHI